MDINTLGQLNYLRLSEIGIVDGLIGWWPLNGNAFDYSGNGNDGTNNGGTIAPGLKGLCYTFDNTSTQNISVANNSQLQLTNFSISIWANWSSFKNYGALLQKGNGGGASIFNYAIWSYSDHIALFIGDGTNNISAVYNSILTLNQWHHIAATVDNSYMTLYIDGTQVAQSNRTIVPNSASTDPLTISSPIYGIYGSLADVKLYNRGLTAAEIGIIYKLGLGTIPYQIADNGTLYLSGKIKEN